MTRLSDPANRDDISTDLVEYIVVAVRDRAGLRTVVPTLVDAVAKSAIRILDMVVVTTDADGAVAITEAGDVDALDDLKGVDGWLGGLLSHHDIKLVSMALQPNCTALVLVVEDRWAESLSAAARAAGGEVLAGERINRMRIEYALPGPDDEGEGE